MTSLKKDFELYVFGMFLKCVRSSFFQILTSRKEKIAKDDMTEPEKNDMLSMMMEAIDEDTNKGFTDQLLKDNMYTFLIAGHETSATALPGVVFYLAKVSGIH